MSSRIKMFNCTPTPFVNGEPMFASYLWAQAPVPRVRKGDLKVSH